MSKRTNSQAIHEHLAAKHQLSTDTIREILQDAFAEIESVTLKSGRCHFRGFGTFKVVSTKAKTGRIINTGEVISIPAGSKVVFSPCRTKRKKLSTEPVEKPCG